MKKTIYLIAVILQIALYYFPITMMFIYGKADPYWGGLATTLLGVGGIFLNPVLTILLLRVVKGK